MFYTINTVRHDSTDAVLRRRPLDENRMMALKMLIPLILLGCVLTRVDASPKKLKVDYGIKFVDYEYPSEEAKQKAIESGQYNITNLFIWDADVDRARNRTFVTVVGYASHSSVPATVSTISDKIGKGGPMLKPYPNWDWYNEENDCDSKIVTVYKLVIDRCNHLWILDSGLRINPKLRICPPKFLQFDLGTDRLIKIVKLPTNVTRDPVTGRGALETPSISAFGTKCNQHAIYMADPFGHALVVYKDFSKDWEFQRLNLLAFHYNTSNPSILIRNKPVSTSRKGIYITDNADGLLFLIALTSQDLTVIPEVNVWFGSTPDHPIQHTVYKDLFPYLPSEIAVSEDHELLFAGLTTEPVIGVWNYRKKNKFEIAVRDPETIELVSGLKVVKRMGRKSELIVSSCSYQDFEAGDVNFDKVNFRIMSGYVDEIAKGTKAAAASACEKISGPEKIKGIERSEDATRYYHPEL